VGEAGMKTAEEIWNSIPLKLQRVLVPLLAVIITLVQISIYVFTMEPDFHATPFELGRKLVVAFFIFIILVVTRNLSKDPPNYFIIIFGLMIVLLGEIENVMDLFYDIVYPNTPFDLEDISGLGLLIMGFGLFRYTQTLIRIKELTLQQKRETEIYADLLKHDLSNDLQALLGYVETTLLDEDKLPSHSAELLSSSLMVGQRMARLIHAFTVRGSSHESEIVELVQTIAKDAAIANRGLSIKVTSEVHDRKLITLGGTLLPCAFENLFRNSHQYAGESPEIEVVVTQKGEFAEIVVSDNGPGIPPEKRAHLFMKGTSSINGGLGLYLTKAIIRACDGTIELLENQPGATFKIMLPLASR
jgi:signal transduction histidine kinase